MGLLSIHAFKILVSTGCRGCQVICVDNFFTGSKENVAHLLGKTNFELMRHDVVEKLLLEVDQIYHLACPASPVHYKCEHCPLLRPVPCQLQCLCTP